MKEGDYNLVEWGVERELLPVLRRHGISLVAYRVLGAGFLGGNFAAGAGRRQTRFAAEHPLGQAMQGLYGGERFARAHEMLEEALRPDGIPLVEAGLRWVCYHSALRE